MDKRKLRLILLAVVGVIILVMGIGAANIYTQPFSREVRDAMSQHLYDRNFNELSHGEQVVVDRNLSNLGSRRLSIGEKNAQFREWLVKIVKWVMIALCAFLILTAALVASRVISNKIKPPSGPS